MLATISSCWARLRCPQQTGHVSVQENTGPWGFSLALWARQLNHHACQDLMSAAAAQGGYVVGACGADGLLGPWLVLAMQLHLLQDQNRCFK